MTPADRWAAASGATLRAAARQRRCSLDGWPRTVGPALQLIPVEHREQRHDTPYAKPHADYADKDIFNERLPVSPFKHGFPHFHPSPFADTTV